MRCADNHKSAVRILRVEQAVLVGTLASLASSFLPRVESRVPRLSLLFSVLSLTSAGLNSLSAAEPVHDCFQRQQSCGRIRASEHERQGWWGQSPKLILSLIVRLAALISQVPAASASELALTRW